MSRKILVIVILCLSALPLLAEDSISLPVDKKIGHALLDSFTTFFHEMAVSGSGGYEKVSKAFEKFMADAKKAGEQKQIDPVFFSRYKRILTIMGLTMIPSEEGIFADILNQEFGHFVKDILGEDLIAFKGSGAVGQLALAVSEEILNLHLYLDNIKAKEKLRKSFEGKFLDATPNKKSVKK